MMMRGQPKSATSCLTLRTAVLLRAVPRAPPAMSRPNSASSACGGRMPAIRPSSTMAMRSQMERSSSSSLETMTMVVPYSRLYRCRASRTSFLAPTSMPRVGSETNSRSRLDGEGLGQADLLLVAARRAPWPSARGPVHLMSSMPMYSSVSVAHAPLVAHLDEPPEERPQVLLLDLHGREGDVPLQALVEEQAHAAPVLGNEGHAHLEGRARRVQGHGLPVRGGPSPPAGNRPMIPLGMPSLPWPARPPMPKISPLRTEKLMSRTVSPGMSTQRCSTREQSRAEAPVAGPPDPLGGHVAADHPGGDVAHRARPPPGCP